MKIAVLMSSYNGEKYIREQIDSILAQKLDMQLDLWVRDDGSTDATKQILQEYEAAGRLRWYTGENKRSAHSFWDMILHCPGYDYYAFADQDDYWEPDKLQNGINTIKDFHTPALSFANALLVDQYLNTLGRNVYKSCPSLDFWTLSCAGGILGCTIVFNQALAALIQACPMPSKIIMHDFYIALICSLAGGTICYNNASQMKYRQHGNNVVGVSRSKLSALKDRLQTITHHPSVTIGQQAHTLLSQYPSLGTPAQQAWLKKMADYRFWNRVRLACSTKTRYPSRNKSITLRLAILFGNR